jgi:hypothetical protein
MRILRLFRTKRKSICELRSSTLDTGKPGLTIRSPTAQRSEIREVSSPQPPVFNQRLTNETEKAQHRSENLSRKGSPLDEMHESWKERLHTSTIKILTNNDGSAASARAAVEPVIPTDIPHSRLHRPTARPPQNSANPACSKMVSWKSGLSITRLTHPCRNCLRCACSLR